MNEKSKFNVMVLGVSCFDGMASSMRVRNLLETSVFRDSLQLHNLIYKVDAYGIPKKKGLRNGINYLVVSASHVLSFFSFTWQGIRFIKKCKSKSGKNIIYNYQYIDIKNLFLLLYARAIGYKIILDIVEDNSYYASFSNFKNRLKIGTSLQLLKRTPSIAHYVVTISHHLQTLMEGICKEEIPVSIIPITVDLQRFEQRKFSIPDSFKIFYGGSFGVKDGMEYLIKAFGKVCEKFDNVELVMTGRASVEDFQKLQSHLGESLASNKIRHLGFLDNNDYYRTLNECHIFCMTRTDSKFANAGFPFKLGEFLSTGKAVIATNVGDILHYLEHRVNAIIIKPESVSELEEAILYLLKNPTQISTIGKQGRKVAEQNFDTYQWSQKLSEIFTEI